MMTEVRWNIQRNGPAPLDDVTLDGLPSAPDGSTSLAHPDMAKARPQAPFPLSRDRRRRHGPPFATAQDEIPLSLDKP
jgi:hypothetical protein